MAHFEVYAVFFVAGEDAGVSGVHKATVEAGLAIFEEFLSAAEAEVGH